MSCGYSLDLPWQGFLDQNVLREVTRFALARLFGPKYVLMVLTRFALARLFGPKHEGIH